MKSSISALKSRRRQRLSIDILEDRQLLSTITVNSTADETTADSTMSLREAIEVSNGTLPVSSLSTQEQAQVSGAVGNTNTIDFNIPTTDPGYDATTKVWTIAVKSGLPAISTNAAIIDGYSQPGASPNTLAQGDNAVLKIAINGSGAGNTIGLPIGQPGSQVRGLDIENFGFNGYGIQITAAGNVQVAGCFIGTDATGEVAAPNATGLEIENSNNLIGGPNVGDRNIISGNSQDGLDVRDQAANPLNIEPTGNRIENNYIGIDAAGTKALGNGGQGVDDNGSGDTYGGTTAGLGNVISGNKSRGIEAGGSVTIEGNDIGTDPTGNVALGNGLYGIDAAQDPGGAPLHSVIITNNVVSGNVEQGISATQIFQATPATYTITNNLVGTNAAGTAALGNGFYGIFLGYVNSSSILDNVIAGTAGVGMRLSNCESDVVQGNLIGTDKTGQVSLGNTAGGIVLSDFIDSGDNTIGGTGLGLGNVIANNGGIGIEVTEGQQNQITHNSIFGNAGAGIYLDPAVGQPVPAPKLTFTPGAGSTGTLSGTLKASPNLAYTLEIFSNPSALPAGVEQGKTFVQDVTVNTDSTGNGTFSVTEPIGFYTATAIDPSGNTSPFSNAVGSAALVSSQTAVSSSANPSTALQSVTFTAVVTAPSSQSTPTGTVTFTIDGQSQTPVSVALVGGSDQAQFTTSTLSAGAHSVSASYSGDTHVSASSGSPLTQTVNAPALQASTTTLQSTVNPSTTGQFVTFTAIVSAPSFQGTLTGAITFTIDGHAEAPIQLTLVGASGDAAFSTSTLSAGSHTISASYSGDSNVSASSGSLPTQTVNAPALQTSITTLASSLNPSTAGQAVTFTAIVSPSGTAGAPSGSVTFTIDGVPKAPVPLQVVNGSDQATLSIASLAKGTHTITAAYSGDASFAASAVASPLVETVKAVAAPAPAPAGAGDGPKVELVQRFGVHMQPTVLVVTFNEALDPASAVNLSNYRITDPAGSTVRIRSAAFDAATNTVTLRPVDRINLHHTYQLRLVGTGPGGIRNTQGELMDGASTGSADGDYRGTLTWRNVVLTPAEALKYGHPSQAKPAGALHHRFLHRSH